MRKFKGKKIIALLLSGVLIAGSADPVMTNAAEVSNEAATDTDHESGAGEGAEEQSTVRESEAGIIEGSTVTESGAEDTIAGGDAEDSADSTSGEAKTEKESSTESTATEESKTEHTTTEESSAESSTTEESSAESSTTEESSAESSTTEESSTESTTEVESGTEKTEEERTTEESTSTEETTETQVTETESTEEEETQEEIKALKSDRQISGEKNILSEYNTSFEGVDGDGNLHWWNHEAGTDAKGAISQAKYEENQSPSSECEKSYLQVQSEKGINKAYIAQEKIAGIIKPEVTYEFTYYAKLTQGTDNGEVQFQVTSASKDWSSQKSASIELDKEIVLDSIQWKQISGQFKLPAHDQHDQVKIEFAGSEGLSFCIDDLRIAAVEDGNTGDDREISESILSEYNTSFEGVDGNGNLHWWNHEAGTDAKGAISQAKYEENQSPSSECEKSYLQVQSEKGINKAYIAQEKIAGIIKPEVTYEFTYYAKLTQGTDNGEVQFQVTSASKDWSSQKSASIELDKEIVLDSIQWKQISGQFKLPAHDQHDQVKIEFAGSDGLSFCIDDLRIAAVDDDNTGDDREISENILSNYNTSFEGVNESGNLYWWNGPSWSSDGISRKAYENSEKPSSDCGDYYLEVSPNDGKSEAQINDAGIAALIQPESTYEFTYYAKLSEGQKDGAVRLEVSGGGAKNAEIKLDKEVTLDAAQWQKVSGTFKLPASNNHKEVKVKFAGSDGLSFCIDDLRVAVIDKGDVEYGDNLVKNPYFAEEDLSMWEKAKGEASISTAAADQPVFDDITTYGVIENRTSSQECFAQDMTGILKSGSSYEYSFYAMLDAEDYKDAPANQREVCFAPFVKVDGESTYWGSYSSGILDSGCIKQIPAGEWTKFEGSFNPKFDGEAEEFVIRILEQGTKYGSGDCVKGRYYVTGVTLREIKKPVKEIEWDIPNLKDTVSSNDKGIGTDAYTGALLTVSDLSDQPLMDLVHKHFNAVTFENEMKMDAMFGYSNNEAPGLHTITWTRADGTEMTDFTVPTLDYSRADKILDALKKWNEENPDNAIKVRGHVLVWHSQAPEWFFHEDWDEKRPDASPEEMDARQEWYIKTVLEHYTGNDSPYKNMFYGWDVVNEAVSDGSGTYRHEDEKSSWWRVYQSEDFIVNAFRYANYYAPSDLELYYNDYNECVEIKVSGIEKLLTEVKSHEKDATLPTRISAMGMQSHHTVTSPTARQLRDAAVRYGKIVGKIQLTELDLKASNDFDGTDATLQDEYTRQAYRYKEIYDIMREVDAMDDIDVNGITVWGVIDGNSWLQDSSDVGGGADGSKRQVPLLFDDDYKAKPSFYAFVNAEKLEPYIRSITVMQAAEEDPYANGKTYEIQGVNAAFTPVWTDTELKIKVTVSDTSVSDDDAAAVYIDWNKSASENADILSFRKTRAESREQEGGYVAEFTVPRGLVPSMSFSMDVAVSDNGQTYAFNDNTMHQETSSKYYASAITKPYMTIAGVGKGVIKVDGEKEVMWDQAKEVQFQIRTGAAKASASARLLWDEQYLYVLADVTDAVLDKSSSAVHEQDSLEVFIDENNHKSDSYEEDDKQYRVNFVNEQSFNGKQCTAENILSASVQTDKGYRIEASYKWTDITPAIGDTIGIDLQINDAEGGTRIGTVSWYDESGMGWSSPSVFGTAALGGLIQTPGPEEPDVKEELNKLISNCETFVKDSKEEDYTQETWKSFIEALETAKQIQNDENAAPEAMKEAYEALIKAKEGLLPNTITTEDLQNLISECETLKQDDYTSESWGIFENALKNANAIISKPDATQAETEEAYKKLLEARAALKPSEAETPEQKELRGLVAECETLKKDDYTADSWNLFSKTLEDAKAVLDKPDAAPEDVQKALAALKEAKAALKKQDEAKPVNKEPLKELLSSCEKLNPNDYTTESWKIYEKALAEAKAVVESESAVQEDVQNAVTRLSEALGQLKEREGLWAFDIHDVTYTGKALKPEVTVYDGKTLLTLGRDYTVSYKKNTKPTEQAEAVIKGKGNYAGSITKNFKIVPKNLADEDIHISNIYVNAPKAGKSVTVAPVVTRNGKKLTKKDFTVDYIKDGAGNKTDRVTEAGTYTVAVKGVDANGYTGTKEIQLVVLNSSQVLMSAAKVTGIQNKAYTGDKAVPEFTVKYGQETLQQHKDYEVFCDSVEVGTATAVIKGTGEKYVGEKTVTFKITGAVLKPADVQLENASNLYYTGNAAEPAVKISGAEQNRDFTVAYDKNVKAGTATVTVKGIGKYTGTVKKTFKIAPFDIQQNPEGRLSYQTAGIKVPYMKGGSKLKQTDLKAVFNGENLVEGTDYTLVYSGNKKTGTATVKIKGKGNFKGTTAPVSFTIVEQDLANLTNIIISDVPKKNAKKYANVSLTIKDFDQKPLKKGTDYSVTFTKQDGTTPITETPVVGDVIRATIKGANNCYTGTIYQDFRIIEDSADISKARVKVNPQYYTGKEITLSEINPITGEQQIFVTIKVGGVEKTLREGTDYEIVRNGYTKNINKGTGKMTIHGINGYGGIKTVSFKITAQTLDRVVWYDNLYKWSMKGIIETFSKESK